MGFPSYFLIDQHGTIALKSDGWDKTARLEAQIQQMLASESATIVHLRSSSCSRLLNSQPGFSLSETGCLSGVLRYIFCSPLQMRRGSLIGKAVVLKTTAGDRLQVRVLSSPPYSIFAFRILDFQFRYPFDDSILLITFLALQHGFDIAYEY